MQAQESDGSPATYALTCSGCGQALVGPNYDENGEYWFCSGALWVADSEHSNP